MLWLVKSDLSALRQINQNLTEKTELEALPFLCYWGCEKKSIFLCLWREHSNQGVTSPKPSPFDENNRSRFDYG